MTNTTSIASCTIVVPNYKDISNIINYFIVIHVYCYQLLFSKNKNDLTFKTNNLICLNG